MSGVRWSNWSGSVVAQPAQIVEPTTVAEVQQLVADATSLRVAGAGYASMPLCSTSGTLMKLGRLDETLVLVGSRAWVPAGWTMAQISSALAAQGRALATGGSCPAGTLAGAMASGAHGGGASFGCLATMATAFRLVLPGGSLIDCSAADNDEIFNACRMSLGALGVIVAIEIETVPAFRLSQTVSRHSIRDVLSMWEQWTRTHRHVELRQYPLIDSALVIISDTTSAPESDNRPARGAALLERMPSIGHRVRRLQPALHWAATRLSRRPHAVGWSGAIEAGSISGPFEQMTYAVPLSEGFRALRAAIREIRKRALPVMLPISFQQVAGDTIDNSPFAGDSRAAITVRQHHGAPSEPLFDAIEPIFRAFAGRPVWSSRHSLVARDLQRLYPRLDNWLAMRDRLDPAGKLLNPCLKALLDR